jgi:hypothetical protein
MTDWPKLKTFHKKEIRHSVQAPIESIIVEGNPIEWFDPDDFPADKFEVTKGYDEMGNLTGVVIFRKITIH